MTLNEFLWTLWAGELSGQRIAEALSRDPFFTDHERRVFARMAKDEARHGKIVGLIATRRGITGTPRRIPPLPQGPQALLRRIARAEGLLLRLYPRVLAPRLNAEERVAFEEIIRDERGHRAFGRRLLHKYGVRGGREFGPASPWREPVE